jgi:hypothetical protein
VNQASASEATVVEVVDEYTCAINRGARSGLKVGDRYLVYGVGNELADPDTGESLGRLELVRGRGKVIHVQERLATIESLETVKNPDRTRTIKREGVLSVFGSPAEEIKEPGKVQTVPFNKIKVGDKARPY